jgi:hypothetical protein
MNSSTKIFVKGYFLFFSFFIFYGYYFNEIFYSVNYFTLIKENLLLIRFLIDGFPRNKENLMSLLEVKNFDIKFLMYIKCSEQIM